MKSFTASKITLMVRFLFLHRSKIDYQTAFAQNHSVREKFTTRMASRDSGFMQYIPQCKSCWQIPQDINHVVVDVFDRRLHLTPGAGAWVYPVSGGVFR